MRARCDRPHRFQFVANTVQVMGSKQADDATYGFIAFCLAAMPAGSTTLSPNERAELAQKLLLSLDDPSEEDITQTWLSEAERRARELDRGEVQPISGEDVRRKARSLLR